jgi:hypothetical protein
MAHWMDVNKTTPDVHWKAVLEATCSGMVRIVGGTNMLVSLVGYSISRTLDLSKKQNFVTSRYFTQSKGRNLELRNHWFENRTHVSGRGFVEQFCEHSPRTALDLLSPIEGPWPHCTLHFLRLVNDPVPHNCWCMLLMPLCLIGDSWEIDASVQTPPASSHPRYRKIDKYWRALRLWTVYCSPLRNGHISWGTKPRHTKISLTNCFTETTCRLVGVYIWHLRVVASALGRGSQLERVVTT